MVYTLYGTYSQTQGCPLCTCEFAQWLLLNSLRDKYFYILYSIYCSLPFRGPDRFNPTTRVESRTDRSLFNNLKFSVYRVLLPGECLRHRNLHLYVGDSLVSDRPPWGPLFITKEREGWKTSGRSRRTTRWDDLQTRPVSSWFSPRPPRLSYRSCDVFRL